MANANVQIKKATKQVLNRRKGTHISTLRVAAYCRVSTDGKEQLESYQSQLKHYTELINDNPEWQMAGIYADEAITGTSAKKRDDFQRMINDCMNGDIDMILVKSISRFARNTLDTLKYVRMLKEKQIAVLFEEENLNTITMDGELLLTILSSVAQQEVQNVSEHVKLGLSMKMQRGEMVGFNGCLGYDYHKEDKTITVNPQEAEIVRYIFNRYIEGAGGKVIARELTNLGFKNKKGNTNWSDHGVVGIIKNEKYKGDLLMGKTFTLDPISKRRLGNQGEADQYYIDNHHEPIVSRELFEQAQAILHRRSKSHSNPLVNEKREKFSRRYSFSCMLKCGFCGSTLSRRAWNSHTDYKKTIWHCVASTKHGKHECPYCKGIPEELIEQAFVRSYNMLCNHDQSFVDSFLDRVKQTLQEDDNGRELKSADKEIIRLKERKSYLVDMRLDDRIDEETYQKKLSEVAGKLDKLYEKKQELQQFQTERQDINKRLLDFQKVLSKHEVLRKFDRHVFECIIDRVIVGEKKESGEIDPYKLKFIYKTGAENGVAVKHPFSFGNPCSQTVDDYGTISLQGENDTCGMRRATGEKERRMIDEILACNKAFVENGNFEQFRTDKYPNKKLAVVTCMDTRLTELLPAALGIKNGDAKIIKNAGGVISHPFGSAVRSLLIAIYELGVTDVMVIGHTDCGVQHMDGDKMLDDMRTRGVSSRNIAMVRYFGVDLESWLAGFDDVAQAVRASVALLRNHPLIPRDVRLYGFVMDSVTGGLTAAEDSPVLSGVCSLE